MKKTFVFIFAASLALCAAQLSQAETTKDTKEANKLALDGAEASKTTQSGTKRRLCSARQQLSTTNTRQISPPFINSVHTLRRQTSNFRMRSTTTAKRSRSVQKIHEFTNSAQRSRSN